MASTTVTGVAARGRLRNIALGLIFVSSLQNSGHTLLRTNSIPAVMPSMAAVPAAVAAMTTRAISANPIAIVPHEIVSRNASINNMSSFRAAAAHLPVYNEATIQSANAARAMRTTLGQEHMSFDRFVFPESPHTEAGETDVPAVPVIPGPTPNPESASAPQAPTPGGPAIMDNNSEPRAIIFATSDSSTQTRWGWGSGSIFPSQQTYVTVSSVFPPEEPHIQGQEPDAETEVSHAIASLEVRSPTSSPRTPSAEGSVTSGWSGPTAGHNDYPHVVGLDTAGSVAPGPVPELPTYRGEDILVDLLAPSTVRDASPYPFSVSPSPEPESEPESEPERVMAEAPAPAPAPAAALDFTRPPFGVRQKHGTWHFTERRLEPSRRQGTKRSFAQTAPDDASDEEAGKRACLSGPSPTARGHYGLGAAAY